MKNQNKHLTNLQNLKSLLLLKLFLLPHSIKQKNIIKNISANEVIHKIILQSIQGSFLYAQHNLIYFLRTFLLLIPFLVNH